MYFVVEKTTGRNASQHFTADILLDYEAAEKGYENGYTEYKKNLYISVTDFETLDEALEHLKIILSDNYDNQMPIQEEDRIISLYRNETLKKEIKRDLEAEVAGLVHPEGIPDGILTGEYPFMYRQPVRRETKEPKYVPCYTKNRNCLWFIISVIVGLGIISFFNFGEKSVAKAAEKPVVISEAGTGGAPTGADADQQDATTE